MQGLLEAAYWTPAIDEAARTHGWTHLVIRNDSPHPQPIPLDRVFDSPLYSVFRFTTTQSSPAAVGSRHDRAGSLDEDAIMPDRQLLRDETSHARAAHSPRRAQGAGAGSRITGPGPIRGRVVDARDDVPLRRARIVVSAGDRRIDSVFTDDEGQFSIADATSDTLTVRVSKAGYAASLVALPLENVVPGPPVRAHKERGGDGARDSIRRAHRRSRLMSEGS